VVERKRISPEALKEAYDQLPEEAKKGPKASLALAGGILRAFFGLDWFDRYVMPEGRGRGFITVNEASENMRDLSVYRLCDLAEVLYNLQNVAGFDACIDRMRNGDIEGTYAELDFGRMLWLHQIPFAYVVPQGVTGKDYDVDILYPNGLHACADAKCKIESTDFGEKTIRNTLDKARKQLPDDKPGIVFAKIPPRWMEEASFLATTIGVAEEFLQTTRRIISVKYYTSPVKFENGVLRVDHAYKEISNRITDFGSGRNWDIFRRIDMRPEWNGMPPWWGRILFYPDGKPRWRARPNNPPKV